MPMIEARDLTKRFGDKVAVDHLSFAVQPGRVTGFLGPNGAGKSTTMRLILGLDRPTSGHATIDGKPYADLVNPLRTVGALLEAKSVHTGPQRAEPPAVPRPDPGAARSRVDAVLDLVGLRDVAKKRAGAYSLGMGQRLGVAAALLGNPQMLLLDEPVNGLDPEGVLWIRTLMKHLAVRAAPSSFSRHLMNEMAVTADHLIVIGRGKLLADASTEEVIASGSGQSVRVGTPEPDRLSDADNRSRWHGGSFTTGNGNPVRSQRRSAGGYRPHRDRLPAARIGELAASSSIVLHELTPQLATLEDAFLELTSDSLEFGHLDASPADGSSP